MFKKKSNNNINDDDYDDNDGCNYNNYFHVDQRI